MRICGLRITKKLKINLDLGTLILLISKNMELEIIGGEEDLQQAAAHAGQVEGHGENTAPGDEGGGRGRSAVPFHCARRRHHHAR